MSPHRSRLFLRLSVISICASRQPYWSSPLPLHLQLGNHHHRHSPSPSPLLPLPSRASAIWPDLPKASQARMVLVLPSLLVLALVLRQSLPRLYLSLSL